MGMTNDGLSYWQAETEGLELLETTLGDLLDSRTDEVPAQLEQAAQIRTA